MQTSHLSRISGAPWFETMQSLEVTLVGVGGIGSHVAYVLSRLGIRTLDIYDFDIVEDVNLTGQMYSKDQVDKNKVQATIENILKYSDLYRISNFGRFMYPGYEYYDQDNEELVKISEYSYVYNCTICGLDNMLTRTKVFNSWLKTREEYPDRFSIFIDGRLAAENFQILTVQTEEDIKKYQKEYLFLDEEADVTICSYKQTTYSAMMIAGYMGNILVNSVYNHTFGPLRTVPFFMEVECPILNIKFEQ